MFLQDPTQVNDSVSLIFENQVSTAQNPAEVEFCVNDEGLNSLTMLQGLVLI